MQRNAKAMSDTRNAESLRRGGAVMAKTLEEWAKLCLEAEAFEAAKRPFTPCEQCPATLVCGAGEAALPCIVPASWRAFGVDVG
jgi:hypothetical protein